MEAWSRSEILNLVGLPFILLAAAATILQVPHTAVRRIMLVLFLAVMAADASFFVWWYSHQPAPIVRRPLPRPSPNIKASPTPSPPEKKNTPQPTPAEDQRKTEPSDEIALNSSTFNDGVTRPKYCLDSAFEGRCNRGPQSIEVVIDRARFELCTSSEDAAREVQFRVGIGKREDVSKEKEDSIIWGPIMTKHITAGKDNKLDFAPGKLLSVNKAQLSKKGPLDLSKYKIIIKVFNPDKRGRYYHSFNLN